MSESHQTVSEEDAFFRDVARARPAEDFEDARVRTEVASRLFGRDGAPSRIDRFTLLEQVGSGGAGVVYAAYDPKLDRKVAIKLLHPEVARDRTVATARLVREAQAAGRLSHPNVVSVFDVGEWSGRVYLAMEFVRGPNLKEWLADQSRDPATILSVFKSAGRGLAAAHRAGIVHRDFKPGNVIITEDPGEGLRARVVDFGLARIDGTGTDEELPESPEPPVDFPMTLTRPGQRMGTPAYMAPEQHLGDRVDARTDQFSFCVALYQALVGRRPFEGAGTFELAESALKKLPPALVEPIGRGLAADPAARFDSMEDLLAAMEPAPRRLGRVAAILGVAVAAGAALVVWGGADADACDRAPEGERQWDDAERSRLSEALAASDVAGARDTWARIGPELDAHAAAWTQTRAQVCRQRARGELSASLHDRARACLAETSARLWAVVDHLHAPTPDAVHNAVEAVAGLDFAACRDPARLLDTLALPDDPALANAVTQARERLQAAAVARIFGDYGGAEEATSQARALVSEGAFPPLDAELLLERGVIIAVLEHGDDPVATLTDAYRLAEQHEHERVRLGAAVALAEHIARTDPKPARVWAEIATALAARTDAGERGQVEALLAMASVEHEAGEYGRARARAEEAAAVIAEALDDRLDRRGRARYVAGLAAFAGGDIDDAAELGEAARFDLVASLGPQHPRVGMALHLLGNAARQQQRIPEAKQAYLGALAVLRATVGDASAKVAAVRNGLGMVAEIEQDFDTAEAEYRAVIDVLQRVFGERSIRVAAAYDNLAIVFARRRDYAQAEAMFREALAIGQETLGEDHPDVASSYTNLGTVLVDQHKYEDAAPYLAKALAIRERKLGPDNVGHLNALQMLARVELGRAHPEAALPWAERAVAIAEKGYGLQTTRLISPLTMLGDVWVALRRPADARAAVERAVAIGLADPTQGETYELAAARFDLAKILEATDKRRAAAEAQAARDLYAALGPGAADEHARVQAWLDAR